MRRYGWQIGGVGIAVALVAALAVLAHSASGHAAAPHERAAVTPRATPTVDVRVAEVEAAAKRYVEALDTAMRTGSPDELDSLSVPGSQAEGNAGVAAHVVNDTGRAFVVTVLDVANNSATLAGSADASVVIAYRITGYDAEWPSLKQLAPPRTVSSQKNLDLTLVGGRWLVVDEQ